MRLSKRKHMIMCCCLLDSFNSVQLSFPKNISQKVKVGHLCLVFTERYGTVQYSIIWIKCTFPLPIVLLLDRCDVYLKEQSTSFLFEEIKEKRTEIERPLSITPCTFHVFRNVLKK